MNSSAPVVVHVARRFDVAAERVFDAWLDPATLAHWMFGPEVRDEVIVRLQLDARVGGRFSFLVRRGDDEIEHVGTYRQIDRPTRLAFTWAAGAVGEVADEESSQVSIEITPRADGCELALMHSMDPKWADYAARAQAGWTTMLEALARHLARQS